MLFFDGKIESIHAVQQLTNNQESFSITTEVNVFSSEALKWTYHQVRVFCGYDAKYCQYDVQIFWEDDGAQSDLYKQRGLFGKYNTNYQVMKYDNGCLVIYDNDFSIYISNE